MIPAVNKQTNRTAVSVVWSKFNEEEFIEYKIFSSKESPLWGRSGLTRLRKLWAITSAARLLFKFSSDSFPFSFQNHFPPQALDNRSFPPFTNNYDQGAPVAEEEQRLQGKRKGQHWDGFHVLGVREWVDRGDFVILYLCICMLIQSWDGFHAPRVKKLMNRGDFVLFGNFVIW